MTIPHGRFGLEKESLRITYAGRLAHTPDPFVGKANITRDFCENQTEINTNVHESAEEAVAELRAVHDVIQQRLAALPDPELLWPFSNPPYIAGETDIPIADFKGADAHKTVYRQSLAARYGRGLMTFCGVHVNYSFAPKFVGDDPNRFYLDLAEQVLAWGWVLTPLTAASPLLDASFCIDDHPMGDTMFAGMSSMRCSELGYWNQFTPVLDYTGLDAYVKSIQAFVEKGYIMAPSEFYYPVRLKPRGVNNLETLAAKGVDHIEIRTVDLNPFFSAGVDVRDIRFIELFLGWCASLPKANLSVATQLQTIKNYKRAAHYDIRRSRVTLPDGTTSSVALAGARILERIAAYYREAPADVKEIIAFEQAKYADPARRPAVQVYHRFSPYFATHGLVWAREQQEESLQHV